MDKEWVPSDTIIKTVCRILIPFIQIYALYVVAHGDFSPGGGFQGGVIFGSSLILLAISYNLKTLVKRVNEKFLGIFSALGVLVYVGIGVGAMVLGGNFLDYDVLAHEPDPSENPRQPRPISTLVTWRARGKRVVRCSRSVGSRDQTVSTTSISSQRF